MKNKKVLPLTETTFYVMLTLMELLHGYVIMQKVEALSEGRVRIAAGTMYGVTENLLKQKWIQEIPNTDKRRRVYMLTYGGKAALMLEVKRLKQLVIVADELFIGGSYEKV